MSKTLPQWGIVSTIAKALGHVDIQTKAVSNVASHMKVEFGDLKYCSYFCEKLVSLAFEEGQDLSMSFSLTSPIIWLWQANKLRLAR